MIKSKTTSKKLNKLLICKIDSQYLTDNLEEMLSDYLTKKRFRKINSLFFLKEYAKDDKFISMIAGESILHRYLKIKGKPFYGKGFEIDTTVKFPQGFDAFGRIDGSTIFGEVKYMKLNTSAITGIVEDYKKYMKTSTSKKLFLKINDQIKLKKIRKRAIKSDVTNILGMAIFEKHSKKGSETTFLEQITKSGVEYEEKEIYEILLISNDQFFDFKEQIKLFIRGEDE